ncbi:uncharacterized protein LOC125510788 isoform X2 [Triticum urartu]|uniref:Uncharacterized protein n=1 Tax=Triticum urartu TaxID=4572 RepID=A0A8R7UNF1_TRIUA|nr:uncharacterized protein LOC123091448 [Triticum aestivum]XP_044368893.1 uncharacterized protein LOC123091448 [Triticum aestivum]XP_048532009.1 uncharacterized protein LOC125510788 isoform X2 [Triticum urartu]
MAFVVFVMGNLFAPCTRHDHSTIDYWGAIKDAENIALFNWCKYSVNFLLEAVRKLKLEIDANITPNHLYGCHLFLQVFVLDNVELGIMNLKQTTIPRIHLFDGETLKRMILVCSARKLGKTIFIAPEARRWNAMCYTWHNYINEKHAKKKSMDHKAEGSANKYALVIHNADNIRQGDYINTDTAISNLAQTHGSNVEFSPGDYARWIQMQNPELAASPLGWALKQHNAKCVHIANEMKRNIARENIRFTKKLLQVYSNRPNTGTPAPNASYRAAGTTKGVDGSGQHNVEAPSRLAKHIVGRRLELSSPSPTPVKYAKPVVLPTADQLSTTPTRGKNGQRQTARQTHHHLNWTSMATTKPVRLSRTMVRQLQFHLPWRQRRTQTN